MTHFDTATENYPIKAGDRVFISNGCTDIEGTALESVLYPFDEVISVREDDGNELCVSGWLATDIEINGVEYQ